MAIDFIGTNLFTDLAGLLILLTIAVLAIRWAMPYINFNRYLNAFKIGLLQKASVREGIDLDENIKKTTKKYVEDVIDQKIKEALEFKENGKNKK